MYASTSAHDPPRCVCVFGGGGDWCACVYVCGRVHARMCVCVCVCVSASARAGDSMSAGCLCFSVCQFHFVLYD